jgi:hypothetical protein
LLLITYYSFFHFSPLASEEEEEKKQKLFTFIRRDDRGWRSLATSQLFGDVEVGFWPFYLILPYFSPTAWLLLPSAIAPLTPAPLTPGSFTISVDSKLSCSEGVIVATRQKKEKDGKKEKEIQGAWTLIVYTTGRFASNL